MSKKTIIAIPKAKPRNWLALAARLKKSGAHENRCSRNAERQAWMRDWGDDLIVPSKTHITTSE